NEVGLERENFFKVGGDERRHPRLLPAHPRRPYRVARHADNAPLLAEEIKRLHGLFGEADYSLGRKHLFDLKGEERGGWYAPKRRPTSLWATSAAAACVPCAIEISGACNFCNACNALLGLGGDQPQARQRRRGAVLAQRLDDPFPPIAAERLPAS